MARTPATLLLVWTLIASVTDVFADEITYFKDVRPILRKHCTICHNDDNTLELDMSGGLSLSKPESFLKNPEVQVVVAGKPDESELLRRLLSQDQDERMPKDDEPLPAESIAVIKRWIETGARVGTPTAESTVRPRPKRSSYRPQAFPLEATPPAGYFGATKSAKLILSADVAPLAAVTALAYSPDDRFLACGMQRRVVVWDLAAGVVAATLDDPIGMVHDLEFTPDSKHLWIAGGDPATQGDLSAYATDGWKQVFRFDDLSSVVYGLAISPDGSQLACTSFDRYLRVFTLSDRRLKHHVKAHSDFAYCVSFSPDGKRLITGSKDRSVKVWDVAKGEAVQSLNGHNEDVLAVLFSPDGKSAYSTGKEPQIRKWDLDKGGRSNNQGGHSGIVYDMAWSADRSRFITGGSDQSVRVWKPDANPEKTLTGSTEVVYAVALSPKGTVAAAGAWDGLVRVWDVATGKQLLTLLVADRRDNQPADWLALSPTGLFSASKTFGSRAQWQMSGATLPTDKVAAALQQPAEIAKAFRGAAPAAVTFAKK